MLWLQRAKRTVTLKVVLVRMVAEVVVMVVKVPTVIILMTVMFCEHTLFSLEPPDRSGCP